MSRIPFDLQAKIMEHAIKNDHANAHMLAHLSKAHHKETSHIMTKHAHFIMDQIPSLVQLFSNRKDTYLLLNRSFTDEVTVVYELQIYNNDFTSGRIHVNRITHLIEMIDIDVKKHGFVYWSERLKNKNNVRKNQLHYILALVIAMHNRIPAQVNAVARTQLFKDLELQPELVNAMNKTYPAKPMEPFAMNLPRGVNSNGSRVSASDNRNSSSRSSTSEEVISELEKERRKLMELIRDKTGILNHKEAIAKYLPPPQPTKPASHPQTRRTSKSCKSTKKSCTIMGGKK